jgi:ferredoxin-nitrate reductase
MDGNTRLCTATAAQALKESFGSDGQPASYADVDTLFLVGHNVAACQTVLWSHMLDHRRGADPPALVVVDPRPTPTAREADLHLAVRGGTNLALLNAIQHELFATGRVDRDRVTAHAVGVEELEELVAAWPPEQAAEVCGVPAGQIREAARIVGGAERLLSTVLQGVYQSNQSRTWPSSASGSPASAPGTPTPWPRSPTATARTGRRSPSASTPSCSAAPARAAWGCCATCTTCT